MKKFMGVFAIILAVVFSSFTVSKKTTTPYSWFDQRTAPHSLIVVNNSPEDNPTDCTAQGTNCVKVYLGDYTGLSEPSSGELHAYAIN